MLEIIFGFGIISTRRYVAAKIAAFSVIVKTRVARFAVSVKLCIKGALKTQRSYFWSFCSTMQVVVIDAQKIPKRNEKKISHASARFFVFGVILSLFSPPRFF